MDGLARRLAVARGDEPADVVVRGGRVLSVFTREWLEADIAVADGWIAGLGEYDGREVVDASGSYVVPGFIDAHMHLESTKLLPDEFARLVLPLGTTAVVADPHEIANVLGTDGVLGLAEMMNFPGVIAGDESELSKLRLEGARHVDGHAPGVAGKELNAYAAAGIRSDHEALTPEEGRERLRAGIWLLIREASMARNLKALVPLVSELGPSRIAFCTDDRDPDDIRDDGHINGMVRKAVEAGVPPEDALVCATLNPATWHGLSHLGAVAPGYQADLLLLPDLESFRPARVFTEGEPVREIVRPDVPEWVRQSVRIALLARDDLAAPSRGGAIRVIGLVT